MQDQNRRLLRYFGHLKLKFNLQDYFFEDNSSERLSHMFKRFSNLFSTTPEVNTSNYLKNGLIVVNSIPKLKFSQICERSFSNSAMSH